MIKETNNPQDTDLHQWSDGLFFVWNKSTIGNRNFYYCDIGKKVYDENTLQN